VLEQRRPSVVDHPDRAGASISKVLSCERTPRLLCHQATFGVVPIVAGSNAPCRGSSF